MRRWLKIVCSKIDIIEREREGHDKEIKNPHLTRCPSNKCIPYEIIDILTQKYEIDILPAYLVQIQVYIFSEKRCS